MGSGSLSNIPGDLLIKVRLDGLHSKNLIILGLLLSWLGVGDLEHQTNCRLLEDVTLHTRRLGEVDLFFT